MSDEKDLRPEGICKYCKKSVYYGLAQHELVCKLEEKKST